MLGQQRGSTRLLLIVITFNIVAIVSVFFFVHYTRIARFDREVLEAQVQIVKACHVRTELVTPLIKLIKAQSKEESPLVQTLIEAQAQSLEAIKKMQSSVARTDIQKVAETQVLLIKTVERVLEWGATDPVLKESESLSDLNKQFEESRDSVDAAGQTYNQAVGKFNSKITKFPGMFIAPLFGWVEKGDYEVRDIKIYFQDIPVP